MQISKTLRLSEHTVRAIGEREAQSIAERKKTLAVMLANVAELGAERMEETIGKASLRDAAIGTGIAVDKMLALTGQTPALRIANIVLPSEEERAERRAIHDRLDAIGRTLQAFWQWPPAPQLFCRLSVRRVSSCPVAYLDTQIKHETRYVTKLRFPPQVESLAFLNP